MEIANDKSKGEIELTNKVLVADDEFLIRWSLSEALSKEGYEVKIVEDGNKALETINSEFFDFVITDLMMPGINGWEVLERIREAYPKTRVVIITAHSTKDTETTAKERGAYGYIEKPEIIDKVKALLRGMGPHDLNHWPPN
jgi:DNA-binding NtrC family response regulator